MKRVILDTNFLTLPHQFGIDIFEEIPKMVEERCELVSLDSVINELEKIREKGGLDGISAKIALNLVEAKGIKILRTKGPTDEEILRMSDKNTIVATNDRNLIKKLKDKNVKVIYLRGKNRLEMM